MNCCNKVSFVRFVRFIRFGGGVLLTLLSSAHLICFLLCCIIRTTNEREISRRSTPRSQKASPCGRKVRCDKLREFVCRTPQGRTRAQTPRVAGSTDNQQKRRRQAIFKAQLKEQPWRSHQSVSIAEKQGHYCMYEHCPGSTSKPGQQIKRQRKGYRTKYRCEG